MVDLVKLKSELDDDPLSRDYTAMLAGADPHQTVVNSMKAVDRDGPRESGDILQYFLLEKFRTNSGSDTIGMHIFGRLELAAAAAEGANVFDSLKSPLQLINQDQIGSAKTMLRLLGPDSSFILPLLDSRFDSILNDLRNSEVFSAGDKTAIQAMSANRISRAEEQEIGTDLGADHIIQALALP